MKFVEILAEMGSTGILIVWATCYCLAFMHAVTTGPPPLPLRSLLLTHKTNPQPE